MSDGAAAKSEQTPLGPPGHPARRSMGQNFLHLGMGQVGTTALGIFLTALLGRWLSEADYGDYNVFLSNWMLAFVVVDWGQQQYLMREVARRPERASDLLGGALAIRLGGGAVAAGVVAAVTYFSLGYSGRTCLLGVLALVTMIPYFLAQGYGVAFKGRERMEYDALLQVLNKLLTLACTAVALMIGWALLGAILAQVVAGAGALVVAVVLARKARMPVHRPSWATLRELLVGGTPIVVMYLANDAQRAIDFNVLKALVPSEVVGWFGAAKNILGTLIAPALIMGGATFPRLSRVANDRDQFRKELGAAVRPVLVMAGYVALGTFVCGRLAVDVIYGTTRYDPAGTILQVSAPSFFLFFVDVLLGAAIVASGRSISMAVAKVVNVAASTALDLWLIPLFQARYGNGGLGATIAYGVSELIMFVSILAVLPRGSVGRGFALDFVRALVTAGGAVAVVLPIPALFGAVMGFGSAGATLLALALSTAVFAALAWATRLVTRADLRLVAELVRRRKG